MGKRVLKARCNRIVNRYKKLRERDNIPKKNKQSRITDYFNTGDADISIEVTKERDLNIEFFQINHQKKYHPLGARCFSRFFGVVYGKKWIGRPPRCKSLQIGHAPYHGLHHFCLHTLGSIGFNVPRQKRDQ